MAESAPLLVETHSENGNHPISTNTTRSSTTLRILKHIATVFSVATLALLIANQIVIRNASFLSYTWGATNANKQLAIFVFVSLIFSVISAAVALHILINFIVDVVLAVGILTWVSNLVTNLPTEDWCKRYNYPPYPNPRVPIPPHPKCAGVKSTVTLLMAIAASFGGIVGVIYITLAVIRVIAILKSKFWKRSTLSFPGAEISFQISLKIRGSERASVEEGEEAGSSTGRGAVYL